MEFIYNINIYINAYIIQINIYRFFIIHNFLCICLFLLNKYKIKVFEGIFFLINNKYFPQKFNAYYNYIYDNHFSVFFLFIYFML